MADQKIEPNVRDLKAWLEARPKLYDLFVSDRPFGERVLTAFDYCRIASRPDAEAFSLIESAASFHSGQNSVGLGMLDKYIDGIKGHFMAAWAEQEKQIAKGEAVNLLRPGHFEDFVLQTDEQFTETVQRFAPIAVQLPIRGNFKNEEDFRFAVLDGAERILRGLGDGTMSFDSKTNLPILTKPIGDILNQEQQVLLRGFIEKKRPRTQEILEQFLSQKN